jgi:hypothetical protein
LANLKFGTIGDEGDFLQTAESFTILCLTDFMGRQIEEGGFSKWRKVEEKRQRIVFSDEGDPSRSPEGPNGVGGHMALFHGLDPPMLKFGHEHSQSGYSCTDSDSHSS